MSDSVAEYLGPHWFTPEKEKPEKFYIRPLDGFEFLEVRNHVLRVTNKAILLDAHGYRFVIDRCLLGWEGVTGRDKQPLKFSPEAKASLHYKRIEAVAAEVMRVSVLSEDQEKN